MPAPQKFTIYLIRHAESTANTKLWLIGGRSNQVELSTLGKQQAKELGLRLEQLKVEGLPVYSSPAKRTLDTAKIALKLSSSRGIKIIDDLQEVSAGSREGKQFFQVNIFAMWRDLTTKKTSKTGENVWQASNRMHHAINQIVKERCSTNHCGALVFGHSMSIRALLFLKLKPRPSLLQTIFGDFKNTEIVELKIPCPAIKGGEIKLVDVAVKRLGSG